MIGQYTKLFKTITTDLMVYFTTCNTQTGLFDLEGETERLS
jgi:hypothetical protein